MPEAAVTLTDGVLTLRCGACGWPLAAASSRNVRSLLPPLFAAFVGTDDKLAERVQQFVRASQIVVACPQCRRLTPPTGVQTHGR